MSGLYKNRKMLLTVIVILFIALISAGYYIWLASEPLDDFSKEIWDLSRKELAEKTLAKEYIELSNNSSKDIELKNSFQVRLKAQKIANQMYEGCKYQKPYIVKYNEKQNAWIVKGCSRYMIKRGMLGGVMYLVLDKESGDILYLAHTT